MKQIQGYGHRQTYRITFSLLTIATAAGTHLPSQRHVSVDVLWMCLSSDLTFSAASTHESKT